MRRAWMLAAFALAGCSLIVPGEGDFTFDDLEDAGVDAGQDDGGPERDSGIDVDGGADGGPSCGAGETVCDGACVDTQSSLEHCGGCGNACAATDRCDDGSCYDPVVEVAAGYGHSCARRASGEVWCWGVNATGQLGDGTMLDRLTPVRVMELEGAAQIDVGWAFNRFALEHWWWSCARLQDGSVRCWGANGLGQLGDGTTERRLRPVHVSGLGAVQDVASGMISKNCAVSSDHQLYCWGGVDSATGMPVGPSPLTPDGVTGGWASDVELRIGEGGCAVGTDAGQVYCWGENGSGQVGDGSTMDRAAPVPVTGIAGAAALATAVVSSCALLHDGTVACWGRADRLGAGLGTMDPQPAPVAVPGLADVIDLDGFTETCAVHGPERRVSCWGDVTSEVEGLTGVLDVAVGSDHKCAVVDDGEVLCWGSNAVGQLGDGTTEDRAGPTPVIGLR